MLLYREITLAVRPLMLLLPKDGRGPRLNFRFRSGNPPRDRFPLTAEEGGPLPVGFNGML